MNTKEYLKIEAIPQIDFSHIFNADEYSNVLDAQKSGQIEITVLTEGSLTFTKDGKTYTAHKDDVICNLYTEALKVCSNAYHEHKTVCFRVPMTLLDTPQKDTLMLPILFTASKLAHTNVHKLIDQIIYIDTVQKDSSLLCSGLFLQLLHELNATNKQNKSKKLFSNLLYVEKAKKYIFDHLTSPIQQREIATHLRITPEYLCAIFKSTEGTSLIEYINKIKLERIRHLVQKDHIKLWKAAEMYGYTDANYVSRLYKKYFGINITDKQNTTHVF